MAENILIPTMPHPAPPSRGLISRNISTADLDSLARTLSVLNGSDLINSCEKENGLIGSHSSSFSSSSSEISDEEYECTEIDSKPKCQKPYPIRQVLPAASVERNGKSNSLIRALVSPRQIEVDSSLDLSHPFNFRHNTEAAIESIGSDRFYAVKESIKNKRKAQIEAEEIFKRLRESRQEPAPDENVIGISNNGDPGEMPEIPEDGTKIPEPLALGAAREQGDAEENTASKTRKDLHKAHAKSMDPRSQSKRSLHAKKRRRSHRKSGTKEGHHRSSKHRHRSSRHRNRRKCAESAVESPTSKIKKMDKRLQTYEKKLELLELRNKSTVIHMEGVDYYLVPAKHASHIFRID